MELVSLNDAAKARHALDLTAASRVALYANESPEDFGTVSLAVLAGGGRTVLPDPRLPPDGWDLDEMIRSGAVNAVVAGSRTLQQLAETGWQARVATVLCNDPLMSASVRGVIDERADRVVAGWGMSEVGVWALFAERADLDAGALGRPAPGTIVRVLDAQGETVPVGVPGDLWIGGPRVEPEEAVVAEHEAWRFAPPSAAPVRMFHTGERVRWTAEGRLASDGHSFREAILDGRRVGLADIESALREEPAVHDAHVAVQKIDGERRLAACVVPENGSTLEVELRVRLKRRLGAVALLDAIVQVPALPRRDDGAIDERKLARQLKAAASARRHLEPRSAAERAIAEMWKDALKLERVGLADNFFELGGHSLLAVQVTLRLEERSGLRSIDVRCSSRRSSRLPGVRGQPSARIRLLRPRETALLRQLVAPALRHPHAFAGGARWDGSAPLPADGPGGPARAPLAAPPRRTARGEWRRGAPVRLFWNGRLGRRGARGTAVHLGGERAVGQPASTRARIGSAPGAGGSTSGSDARIAGRGSATSRVILWDPILDGRGYVDELARDADDSRTDEWEVRGFPVGRAFREEIVVMNLGAVRRVPPDARIIVTHEVSGLAGFQAALEARRIRVEVDRIDAPCAWTEDRVLGLGAVPAAVLRRIVEWAA